MIKATPVILCGDSGTRLWPLSRTGFPKQFLRLTGKESLLQQAALRLANMGNANIQVAHLHFTARCTAPGAGTTALIKVAASRSSAFRLNPMSTYAYKDTITAPSVELWCPARPKITNGDKVMTLPENQSTYIPQGEVHRPANPSTIPLEIIKVQSGSYLGEDDIVRFEDTYGRVKS